MSLRDELLRTIRLARHDELDNTATVERILGLREIAALDRYSAGTLLMPEPMTIQFGAPSGIDQGVTRLAFLAFVRGHNGMWNGERRVVGMNRTAWVRYRGHRIDRESTPDGMVIRITYRDHIGAAQVATYPVKPGVEDPTAAQWVTDLIDDLIDVVIEHHGVPGEELVDAEIVETLDASTAARVIDSYAKFALEAVSSGQRLGKVRDYYIRAIERGEVQP